MGLELLYEKKEDSVKILRCFGETDEIWLPDQIEGLPVAELGGYIFSEGMRTEAKGFCGVRTGKPGRYPLLRLRPVSSVGPPA